MLNFWTIIFCPWKFLFLLKPEDDFEETHDLDVRAGPSKRSPGSDLNVLPFSLEAWAVQIGPGPNRSQQVPISGAAVQCAFWKVFLSALGADEILSDFAYGLAEKRRDMAGHSKTLQKPCESVREPWECVILHRFYGKLLGTRTSLKPLGVFPEEYRKFANLGCWVHGL